MQASGTISGLTRTFACCTTRTPILSFKTSHVPWVLIQGSQLVLPDSACRTSLPHAHGLHPHSGRGEKRALSAEKSPLSGLLSVQACQKFGTLPFLPRGCGSDLRSERSGATDLGSLLLLSDIPDAPFAFDEQPNPNPLQCQGYVSLSDRGNVKAVLREQLGQGAKGL